MNHKYLFHIYNKQHLLCTCGNFCAIRSCRAKIWWNNEGYRFYCETWCMLLRVYKDRLATLLLLSPILR